jgi:hypothetical protein
MAVEASDHPIECRIQALIMVPDDCRLEMRIDGELSGSNLKRSWEGHQMECCLSAFRVLSVQSASNANAQEPCEH